MKTAPMISLGVSVVLGAGAILFGRGYMVSKERDADAQVAPLMTAVEMTSILVSTAAVERGGLVDGTVLRSVDWPTDALPPSFVTDVSEIGEGMFARGLIVEGEPIALEKLDETRSMMTLASAIRPGMRAVSITVRSDTGVSGFVLPGDRVDVTEYVKQQALGVSDNREGQKIVANPILHDVNVLAVDQTFDPGLEGARPSNTVTLEVTPEQAMVLGVSAQRATLGLSLIGREEEKAISEAPKIVPVRKVRGSHVSKTKPQAPKFQKVTIIHGTSETEVSAPVAKSGMAQEGK